MLTRPSPELDYLCPLNKARVHGYMRTCRLRHVQGVQICSPITMTKMPFPSLPFIRMSEIARGREIESEPMFCSLKLQCSKPTIEPNHCNSFAGTLLPRRPFDLRLPGRRFSTLSLQSENASSEPSISSSAFTSSVGSPPSALQLSQWNLTHRHILMLNVIACAVAVSATWLFCSAIPTLLAFKRAAESLEKLFDVTREELPSTMAAVRLSGMEISDLTMELSDLGQEITQGVRSSTRAVRLAEERLRRLTNMAPPALVQEVGHPKTKTAGPLLARSARGIREGIVKGRAILLILFTLTKFSRSAFNYFTSRAKR